jgi:hypothetical protein
MVIFEHEGKEYKARNEASEVTLHELSMINALMSDDKLGHVERWIRLLELVSDDGLSAVIDDKGLLEFIKQFRAAAVDTAIVEEIEVNGRVYRVNLVEGELKVSAKEMALLEKYIRKYPINTAYVFAIIYKDVELSDIEHFEDAHIQHKKKQFSVHINADVAVPIIFAVNKLITEHFQNLAKVAQN